MTNGELLEYVRSVIRKTEPDPSAESLLRMFTEAPSVAVNIVKYQAMMIQALCEYIEACQRNGLDYQEWLYER